MICKEKSKKTAEVKTIQIQQAAQAQAAEKSETNGKTRRIPQAQA